MARCPEPVVDVEREMDEFFGRCFRGWPNRMVRDGKVEASNGGKKMIARTRWAGRRVLPMACLLAILAALPTPGQDGAVVLTGQLVAAGYDDDGEVESVAVYDSEWGSVLVSSKGKGKELLGQVDAVVEITGKIVELDDDDSWYSHTVEVTSYTIVEPARPEEDRDP